MSTTISSLNVVLSATVSPFVRSFKQAGGAARELAHDIQISISASAEASAMFSGAEGSVSGFSAGILGAGSSLLKLVGISALFSAAWGVVQSAIGGFELTSQIEQTTVAMGAMLKSTSQAKSLIEDLTKFTIKTPFRLPEVSTAAKRLIATGSAAGNVVHEMTVLGNVSSGTGTSLDDIVNLFGKIRQQGRLTGLEMRQFRQHSIPIYDELAKVLGVDKSQIDAMVSAGKIGFSSVQKALEGMTSAGGIFENLMERQSHTLGGLWSNLLDAIGLNAVKVFLKLADLFNIRGLIQILIDGASRLGTWVVDAANRYGDLIVQAAQYVWAGLVSVWNAIADFITPIVETISGFIADNWQQLLMSAIEYWSALYNLISTVAITIWQVLSDAVSGLVTVWDWAMGELGMQTLGWRDKTTTSSEKIVAVFKWLYDSVSLVLNATAYVIKNWQLVFTIAALEIGYEIVKLGNQIEYVLVDVIGGYLSWAADNWMQVWATIANFLVTVFDNMLTNAKRFGSVLWDALTGGDSEMVWEPLLKGFHSALTQLPAIAERAIGPIEMGMFAELTDAEQEFSDGLDKSLSDDTVKAKEYGIDAVTGVQNVIDAVKDAANAPDFIDIKDFLNTDTTTTDNIKADKAHRKSGRQDQNDLVRAGGAAAQRLQFQGMMSDRPLVTLEDLQKQSNEMQKAGNADLVRIREAAEDGDDEDAPADLGS